MNHKIEFTITVRGEGSISLAEEVRRNFLRMAEQQGLIVEYQSSAFPTHHEVEAINGEKFDVPMYGEMQEAIPKEEPITDPEQAWRAQIVRELPDKIVVVSTTRGSFPKGMVFVKNLFPDPRPSHRHPDWKGALYWRQDADGDFGDFFLSDHIVEMDDVNWRIVESSKEPLTVPTDILL